MVRIRSIPPLACALTSAFLATALAGQQVGSIVGAVLDETTLTPLVGANVLIVDHKLSALTNEDGQFSFRDVPTGDVYLRIEHTGHVILQGQVTVTPQSVAFVHFHLSSVTGLLDRLRVDEDSATDVSAGGAFIEILPKETETALSALALLSARDPSISVRGPTLAGTRNGSDIRLRGVRSASASNVPSVYVDGTPTDLERLADISATEVFRIRVLRGPSAASMYPDAANGVILVETWKGKRKP